MTYDNNNRGAYFSNDRKKEDRDPDFTGNCVIDQHKYYIDGYWDGDDVSLTFKPEGGTALYTCKFSNVDKKNDRFPDRKGELDIDGKKHEVAGWKRIGNKPPHKKFMSISTKPLETIPDAPPVTNTPIQVPQDDLPF